MTEDRKLEQFEQAILKKARTECEQILKDAQDRRKAELDQEENRMLEEVYRGMQAEIAHIQAQTVREVSRETQEMKRSLYLQRERYLSELMGLAHKRLEKFAAGPDYAAWLDGCARAVLDSCNTEGGTVFLRPADMTHAKAVSDICGGCPVREDERIRLGGLRLENPARNISVDLTLDTALEQQKEWFVRDSSFIIRTDAISAGEEDCDCSR